MPYPYLDRQTWIRCVRAKERLLLAIEHRITRVDSPRTHDFVERTNRTLQEAPQRNKHVA